MNEDKMRRRISERCFCGAKWSNQSIPTSPGLNFEDYYSYLQRRSKLALFYRRFFLFPTICRCVSGRVLDIGCGIGDFLAYRPNTVGVEVNPFAVEHCLRNGFEAYLVNKPPMPFSAHSFSGAVMDNVLEHLNDPRGMLEDIWRVLTANGTLVIGVPGRKGFESDPDHKHFYDETRLRSDLKSSGFHCEKVWHQPLRASWLEHRFSQFALYGAFSRVG
jgi:SAM-dependent methyltransferase